MTSSPLVALGSIWAKSTARETSWWLWSGNLEGPFNYEDLPSIYSIYILDIYIYMYTYIYICLYIYIHVHMYVFVCTYIHIYIYIYTYTVHILYRYILYIYRCVSTWCIHIYIHIYYVSLCIHVQIIFTFQENIGISQPWPWHDSRAQPMTHSWQPTSCSES